MSILPAILIGGPPHAGKSVLAYSLSRALRSRHVPHYVLRAYPDGEGDWANQAEQTLVRAIRLKGYGSREWVAQICRDIAQRHLPLIVDPGGNPTAWQEAIFEQCTHALLLIPRSADAARETWRTRIKRHGLSLIADLDSDLAGSDQLDAGDLILRGTLAGLERGRTASGACFEALVHRIAQVFQYSETELRAHHLGLAPVELVVELERLGRTLDTFDTDGNWIPASLERVLDYLPTATPLGVYGRGPNWLYAALAATAQPAPLYQFDARLGWIAPPKLNNGTVLADSSLQVTLHETPDQTRVEFVVRDAYLDYTEANGLTVPLLPRDKGIVLSGKLPLWLWTALALTYLETPWLAIYQPQLGEQAIVVQSAAGSLTPGALIASSATLADRKQKTPAEIG